MAATTIIDAIGTPITLGSTVRLTGTVTGISPFDTHYGEITVTPQYAAVPKANMGIVHDIANGIAQPTINSNPINVAPGMILVGAGGTGGMNQTPWTSDIDGGGFKLFNVASIATGPVAVTGDVNITGAFKVNGVVIATQTPWTQNIFGAGFSLSGASSLSANNGNFTNVNVTGAYSVNGQPLPKQTPWLQGIDGGGFALSNVSGVASTGNITAVNVNITGSYQVNGTNLPGQTPWLQNIDAGGFSLNNLAGMLGISVASPAYALDVSGDINCTGTFRVGGVPFTSGVPPTRQVIGGAGMGGGGNLSADVTLTANVISVFGRIGPVVLQAADISAAGGVLTTRNINTGSGMLGGGALSADINLTSFNNVYVNGTLIGARVGINIVAGSNVTVAASDDASNNKVNVTITSTGTTGSGSPQTPWASNIDAAGFALNNAGNITSIVFISSATGTTLAFETPSSTATITGAGDAKFNSITIPSGTAKATITSAGNASFASVTSNGVAVLTSLPISTATVLGGVKIGANVSVAADGTISVAAPNVYTLPAATATLLGGVKIGANVSVAADGTISVAAPVGSYTLPAATATVLGGVKIGANISVAGDGTISVAASGGSQTPWASDIDAAGHNLLNCASVGAGAANLYLNTSAKQRIGIDAAGHVTIAAPDNTTGGALYVNGNVGIGPSAPQVRLHVIPAAPISVPPAPGTYGGAAIFGNDLATYGLFVGALTTGNGYIQVQRGDTATVYNLLLQPNGGNVGVANSAPAYPLDVTGDIHCTGSLRTTTIAAGAATLSLNTNAVSRLAIDTAGHVAINAPDDGAASLRATGSVVLGCYLTTSNDSVMPNSSVTLLHPSNTQLSFRVKCGDGVFRTATLTLA